MALITSADCMSGHDVDKRLEQVDKRFDELKGELGTRIELSEPRATGRAAG